MSATIGLPCDVHKKLTSITSCLVCGNRLCEICTCVSHGMDYCERCAPVDATVVAKPTPLMPVERMLRSTSLKNWIAGYVDTVFGLTATLLLFWILIGRIPNMTTFILASIMLLMTVVIAPASNLGLTGKTIGNHITGTIVLKPDGCTLSWSMSIKRTCIRFICIVLGIPILQMFFSKSMGDSIDQRLGCGTYGSDQAW